MLSDGGQSIWHDAQLAAALVAIDSHGLGGICVKSQYGPVRDAWWQFVQSMLPSSPVQKIPPNISDEQLLGGLDLEATLAQGKPIYNSGVLARCDGGLALLPMAERMPFSTVALLSQAMDRGRIDSDSQAEQSVRCLFGIVAFDEGLGPDEAIHPRLAERLAFQIHLDPLGLNDSQSILEITPTLIAEAKKALPHIDCDARLVESIMQSAATFGIDSIRAGLFAIRAAKALAALRSQSAVSEDEVVDAARLVFSHRATRMPTAHQQDHEEQEPADHSSTQEDSSDRVDQERQADSDHQSEHDKTPPKADPPSSDTLDEMVVEAIQAGIPANLLAQLNSDLYRFSNKQTSNGQFGQLQKNASSGRPAESRRGMPTQGKRLDLLKTLRAAIPWQMIRKADAGLHKHPSSSNRSVPRIQIRADDLHIKRYQQHQGVVTIFLVDASGSSATQRLAEAKGAIEQLLADCYIRRDEVAMLSLRGRNAEVVLPPTRSLVRAKRNLAALPGGGGTPLASGLMAVNEMATSIRRKGMTPIIVIMTDGVANVTLDGVGGRERAHQDALNMATRLRAAGHRILFIDTASAPHALAKALASAMDAHYLPLPYVHSGRMISKAAMQMAQH